MLAATDRVTLESWREAYLAECIEPMIQPRALELLAWHRDQGHRLVIITATNRFVTERIATRHGVSDLLATEPEQDEDGRFTGRLAGTPCFQDGKVQRLQAWLAEQGETLEGAWFYSDSRNDLPLLEVVTNPVVVDADEVLTGIASERGWPRISLRG